MSEHPLLPHIRAALHEVEDPEIRRPITDLGMVDDIQVTDGGDVAVRVLLTVSGCPMRSEITTRVTTALRAVEGVREIAVELGVMNDEQREAMRTMLRGGKPAKQIDPVGQQPPGAEIEQRSAAELRRVGVGHRQPHHLVLRGQPPDAGLQVRGQGHVVGDDRHDGASPERPRRRLQQEVEPRGDGVDPGGALHEAQLALQLHEPGRGARRPHGAVLAPEQSGVVAEAGGEHAEGRRGVQRDLTLRDGGRRQAREIAAARHRDQQRAAPLGDVPLDEQGAAAGGGAPVDVGHVVADDVLAQVVEVQAAPDVHGRVHALELVRHLVADGQRDGPFDARNPGHGRTYGVGTAAKTASMRSSGRTRSASASKVRISRCRSTA